MEKLTMEQYKPKMAEPNNSDVVSGNNQWVGHNVVPSKSQEDLAKQKWGV